MFLNSLHHHRHNKGKPASAVSDQLMNMNNIEEIEEIDISPFLHQSNCDEKARKEVCAKWNQAFQKHGFAIISGHGVPEDIVERLREDTRKFFALDLSEKSKASLDDGFFKGGYVPVGVENVALSGESEKSQAPDYVENILFTHGGDDPDVVPKYPPRFKTSIQEYCKHLTELFHLIMEISEEALGLPKGYFSPFFTPPGNAFRLAYYPAQDKKKPADKQMRFGAHTDYTGFTLLKQDDEVGGLEVFNAEKETWIPVKIVENSFVVNAGDFIQRWTNDHWISNLHRVVNPPADKCHKDRLSLVFFTGPNDDATVAPIKELCGKDELVKYEPVLAKDYLFQKLNVTCKEN